MITLRRFGAKGLSRRPRRIIQPLQINPLPPPTNEWKDPTPPKTEEELVEERVKEALSEWPWKGLPTKLITVVRSKLVLCAYPSIQTNIFQAPYTFNENAQFAQPQASQETSLLFTKIFRVGDSRHEIIHELFKHYDAAWKFSATCREAWDLMRFKIVRYTLQIGLSLLTFCLLGHLGYDQRQSP